jgi:hypothetical protein
MSNWVKVVAALAVIASRRSPSTADYIDRKGGEEEERDIWDIDLGKIKVDKELTKKFADKYAYL